MLAKDPTQEETRWRLDSGSDFQDFDRFQADRLGPAIGELGDQAPPGPPDIKEFPVYNVIKP